MQQEIAFDERLVLNWKKLNIYIYYSTSVHPWNITKPRKSAYWRQTCYMSKLSTYWTYQSLYGSEQKSTYVYFKVVFLDQKQKNKNKKLSKYKL